MDGTTNESFRQKAIHERLILEAAKDYAIFTTDLERRITSWNAGAETLFGYAEADIMGQLADVLYIPEDRPGVPRHELEKALAEGRAENERWHLRNDGSRIYGSGVVTPLHDETATLVGLVKVMRDLTHQKQAEATRNQSEERFRAFVTATSDAVYRMSADWREMHQLEGKSFLPDTSTTGSLAARTSWLERYIPLPDQAAVQEAINEAIRNKKPFELAHRVIQADGCLGWTFSRAIPILDQQGEITEWFGTASDITRQKQAEESLAQSEKEYRWLFETMNTGFALCEAIRAESGQLVDYRLVQLNPAFEKLTGIDRNEAVGRTILALLPDLDPWWLATYQQVLDSGETVHVEQFLPQLARWYDIVAFRYSDEQFAVHYNDITIRKRAEETLRQNKERQAFLLALSDALQPLSDPTAIQATATQLVMTHFRADRCYYCELVGDHAIIRQDAARTDGTAALPSVVGNYRLSQMPLFKSVVEAGQPFVVQDSRTTDLMDEPLRQLCIQLQILSYINTPVVKHGQTVGIFCVTQCQPRAWTDIDAELIKEVAERTWAAVERAHAEVALARSERFVQGVVTSLPLVIYIFDLVERRNRYLSPQIMKLFGYTLAEMQDSGTELIQDFFHPDDRPRLAAHFEHISTTRAEAEGYPAIFQIECRIRHRERGWVWVQCRDAVYQRDAEGYPTLLLGTAEDITDRRRTNEALQESEKRFRLAIEAAELGTWEWDLLTNEVFWNEQHFRLFGMQSAAAVPQLLPMNADVFLNHIHPADRERVTALLQRAIADRSVYDTEFCALLDDGSERWMSGYGRIVEELDGNPVRMSGVMFDIDERRRAEDALRLADQRKNEFLALLAHELRNPLATLNNTLLILKRTGGTHEAMTLPMATTLMRREVTHLVRLVDDLLDVSRISRGKIVLTKKRIDLVSVVRETAEAVDGGFRAANRTLTIDLPTEPIYLPGDATRLKQVVSNLLNNALKFTRTGGHVWVSLDTTRQEPDRPMARLRVRDDGIGIADHERERIFQMFVQVDSSLGRTQDGLGLGLTLVSELVGLHGGRVAVQSKGEGHGSEFIVYLPVKSENNSTNGTL